MYVIVPTNNKGGTGKTTIATMLCHYFAKQGKRVLGIDLDPQCNFSRRFINNMVIGDGMPVHPPPHPEFDPNDPEWDDCPDGIDHSANLFYRGSAVIYPTNYENVDMYPGHEQLLIDVERTTIQKAVTDVHYQMMRVLQDPFFEKEYDVVIIDTGPSKGPLTSSAIHAATHILIPAKMEEMSIEGLNGMLSFWERINQARDEHNQIKLIGIIANMFKEQSGLHQDYFKVIADDPFLGEYLIEEKIHDWQDYAEAAMPGNRSVLDMAPSSKARKEAERVCKSIVERL